MSSSRRCANWSVSEDVALCNAWVSISEDDAVGINQTGESFWRRIYVSFSQNCDVLWSRDSIESRFKIINHQCSSWKSCVRKASVTPTSGSNLANLKDPKTGMWYATCKWCGIKCSMGVSGGYGMTMKHMKSCDKAKESGGA
ncbi:unnamed protein product, partial [Cuscuta europaea]